MLKEFKDFLIKINLIEYEKFAESIIISDGDKCEQYRKLWQKNNIPFERGIMLYLITKIPPYSYEVRDTDNGFVEPYKWVIDNYNRFKKYFD